jgi:hypothetical protein
VKHELSFFGGFGGILEFIMNLLSQLFAFILSLVGIIV